MRWALGSDAELQRLWRAYGIQPQSDDAEHTASTVAARRARACSASASRRAC